MALCVSCRCLPGCILDLRGLTETRGFAALSAVCVPQHAQKALPGLAASPGVRARLCILYTTFFIYRDFIGSTSGYGIIKTPTAISATNAAWRFPFGTRGEFHVYRRRSDLSSHYRSHKVCCQGSLVSTACCPNRDVSPVNCACRRISCIRECSGARWATRLAHALKGKGGRLTAAFLFIDSLPGA